MKSFSLFLHEGYKNFVGPSSTEGRERYVDQVWDILQKSYAPIGGIKGSGFGSKEELVAKIPMWKIFVRGDTVKVAAFYKDKNGRKAVAIATDGSDEAKKIVRDVYKAAFENSYGEKSGAALGTQMKLIADKDIPRYFMKPEQVEALTGDKCIPVTKFGVDNLDPADRRTWDKFPQLHPYFYVRELGGEMHMKATSGTANLPIIRY
jgi:hypothetical protein